mmetsp:Transcript_34497/g.75286  ORF Transcript_34497/g.75286 Transcript_34497/m.75286 type:complete len:621 (-) Transcript_34497:92-1954(-)
MEFLAVAKEGVQIFSYQPGEEVPSEPVYTFPPVPTADGICWSPDGMLLALFNPDTGGIVVYNSAADYAKLSEVQPIAGGPVRSHYFSPLGTHLVTWERYVKDGGPNVALWEAATGELKMSFILKKYTEMSWPPLKWTMQETHCCRMVQDAVVIMAGNVEKGEPMSRIEVPGVMTFEVAPKGTGSGPPHVAVVIAESKGSPARCQIYSLESPGKPTASKSFFKAQAVTMSWNNTGSALLVKTMVEVDDTGKCYYGNTNLYFMRPDGQEDCIVCSADQGPVHDVQWNPTQDEFLMLNGQLPCAMNLFDGKKATQKMNFGTGHRNLIRFNNFGRFLVIGGHGQLVGDTDFWDKPGKKLLGTTRMECCVVCGWAPDGRHFLGATTAPRMRVDNKIQIYDYCGNLLGTIKFPEELLQACWRPRPRGAFQDRPPSPGRGQDQKKVTAAAPKPKAYRPPAARAGAGGLADLLRQELGSTQAGSATTATKVSAVTAEPQARLPPGMSPDAVKQGAGSANSRNARRKKAQQAAEEAEAAAEQERLAAARTPGSGGGQAPATFGNEGERAPCSVPSDPAEVEKKVRAIRKKLRDIEKLKEKTEPLDPLQQQKIDGEGELLNQLRDLGAEP